MRKQSGRYSEEERKKLDRKRIQEKMAAVAKLKKAGKHKEAAKLMRSALPSEIDAEASGSERHGWMSSYNRTRSMNEKARAHKRGQKRLKKLR